MIDIGLEGDDTFLGDHASRQRSLSLKCLFNRDVPGLGQFVELYAKVAGCRIGFVLDEGKVGGCHTNKQ